MSIAWYAALYWATLWGLRLFNACTDIETTFDLPYGKKRTIARKAALKRWNYCYDMHRIACSYLEVEKQNNKKRIEPEDEYGNHDNNIMTDYEMTICIHPSMNVGKFDLPSWMSSKDKIWTNDWKRTD